ncbi:glycosyltransferase family A protein [Pedobacter suwonensis]|uniref:glycosyltransferase family A protein n=1 Tax=Pedobacter suwonensis TaxID=332999 RepID=UPI0025DB71E8|nr:glycosyltransferase family 2 protein [uncultured Pedobacter sp.]
MNINSGLSIVLTYYKGEKYIFHCLDSIFRSYKQSRQLLKKEVVVVIDSMEDAERIADEITKRYLAEDILLIINPENLGVANSRNVGLKRTQYSYYTIIDQDDYVKDNYFSTLEEQLDPSVALHIINGVFLYHEQQKEIPIYYIQPDFRVESILMQTTTIYTPGTVIFNSNFINKDNAFIDASAEFKGADDWAAYLDIIFRLDRVNFKFIKEKIFVYRLHQTNYSNNTGEMVFSSIAVLDYLAKKYTTHKALVSRAKERYHFLYALKVEKQRSLPVFRKFPGIFIFHYFTSLMKRDRINRLIFRLDKIRRGIK